MFCMGWYYANVNTFTLEAGVMGELIRDVGLRGMDRQLFLQAQSMIYTSQQVIAHMKAQKEAESNG
jgi:hypothetical protein